MTAPPDPSAALWLTIADGAPQRLDKALADAAEAAGAGLSRSRLAQLIAAGAVRDGGGTPITEAKRKVKPGAAFQIALPPPVPAEPQPEDIPLDIVHEDADLLVVNKPAGMVVHPAPGAESGTLVNALLAHCGDTLPGIGGERRPGIVHRIDKDTSGLLVVAKTEVAMTRLAAQFADHSIRREYLALCWGAPDRGDPRLGNVPGVGYAGGTITIDTMLDRDPSDRKRMAVHEERGRRAISHFTLDARFGPAERPFAAQLTCRLETGRTHQIRVHAAHIGHALIGDPVYGRPRALPKHSVESGLQAEVDAFNRQALHAKTLEFQHPTCDEWVAFAAPLPRDLDDLLNSLRRNT